MATCGVAGIYSDVEVYADCVRHGQTGLLVANNAEAWYRALRKLVDDASLRKIIQRGPRGDRKTLFAGYIRTRFLSR